MNVLVLGSGGREHALVWKLAQSPSVERLFAMPGNPGIEELAATIPGNPTDPPQVLAACEREDIDLVVVGPERPLIAGVADVLRQSGIATYGPGAEAARIEGSKAFAKQLMEEEGIPTARFATFVEFEQADAYIRAEYANGRKVVVKASGEALGKGAVVCDTEYEAVSVARRMLVSRELGEAGATIVVEERLFGREVSLLAACNGSDYVLLPGAQDYKAAYDGGVGPNTGGMGAVSPVGWISDTELAAYSVVFIAPVLARLKRDGCPFVGTLYAGLMVTNDGPRALEYNARFGDPETQAILPRLDGDFALLLWAAAHGLSMSPPVVREVATCVVVLASPGYPGDYEKGLPVKPPPASDRLIVFHAGTRRTNEGLVNSGGRVLNVVGVGRDVQEAREQAYAAVLGEQGMPWHYRRDIGAEAPVVSG